MSLKHLTALVTLGVSLGANSVAADQHGNALVHARELNGEVFMMNQYHMSLYTFDADQPDVSTCLDACAEIWPPAVLPEGSELGENYTLFTRADGTMQIAYKGHPLYLYSGDTKVGQTNGDGIDGTWCISRPLP